MVDVDGFNLIVAGNENTITSMRIEAMVSTDTKSIPWIQYEVHDLAFRARLAGEDGSFGPWVYPKDAIP